MTDDDEPEGLEAFMALLDVQAPPTEDEIRAEAEAFERAFQHTLRCLNAIIAAKDD